LEKEWNSSQITKSRKDGGVDFSITVCDLIEIKAWILSWGEHAKVIGPKELAEDIKEELDKMVKKYQ
jgi:predicted DNA-binding transcriptional regulator YafY